jgi:hypothetical protein
MTAAASARGMMPGGTGGVRAGSGRRLDRRSGPPGRTIVQSRSPARSAALAISIEAALSTVSCGRRPCALEEGSVGVTDCHFTR